MALNINNIILYKPKKEAVEQNYITTYDLSKKARV